MPLKIGWLLIGLAGLAGCGGPSPSGPQVITQCADKSGDVSVSCTRTNPPVQPPIIITPTPVGP